MRFPERRPASPANGAHPRSLQSVELSATEIEVIKTSSRDIEDYRRGLFAERTASNGSARAAKSGNARREARRAAAKSREASASLRRTAKAAEREVELLSAELSRIETKLAQPDAYTVGSDDLEALLKKRGAVEKALAVAEARWLAAHGALERETSR